MRQGTAIVMRRTGPPSVLSPETVSIEAPGPGELLIRQTAVGINFLDIYFRRGAIDVPCLPFINGFEGVGVVEAVGPGLLDFSTGDRVGYALEHGAYADYRLLRAARAIRLPSDISDSVAAASLLKGMTAEYLLHRSYVVAPEDIVVVHAAAGGVGSLLCQWAKHKGATVIGTVGSDEKAAVAANNGCDHVFKYEGWIEAALAATSRRRPNVVYDGVGRTTFPGSLSALRERGACVVFGSSSGNPERLDVAALNRSSITLSNPGLQHFISTPQDLALSSERLFHAIRSGILRIGIGHEFELREMERAHALIETRMSTGSIVARPGQ